MGQGGMFWEDLCPNGYWDKLVRLRLREVSGESLFFEG